MQLDKTICNNFGVIGSKSSAASKVFDSKQSFSSKNAALEDALREVELNTPDSVRLACVALEVKGIELPDSLRQLKDLQLSGRVRNELFALEANCLKSKSMEEIGLLMEAISTKDKHYDLL